MRDSTGKFTIIHGETNTKLYRVWESMKGRCLNPNHKAYLRYGGRGIGIEEISWLDFVPFRNWALSSGYKEGLSLDRIDNNKGYCPQNCCWITRGDNSRKDKGLSVNQLSLDGNLIATYPSIAEARRQTGAGHICEVLRGSYGYRTSGGYRWEYAHKK